MDYGRVVIRDAFGSMEETPPPLSGVSPVVFLLDDDPRAVVALGRILRAKGFSIRAWTSPIEFLDVHDAQIPGCLVMDVRMAEMSGLEVQRVLLARGVYRPIIFITGQGDIRTTVLGMRAGAVSFLTKPIESAELVGYIREAIKRDAASRERHREQAQVETRLAQLSRREREVLPLLTTGLLNKQIAAELGTAERTIKVHRRRILQKMQVRTATALTGLLYRARPHAYRAD